MLIFSHAVISTVISSNAELICSSCGWNLLKGSLYRTLCKSAEGIFSREFKRCNDSQPLRVLSALLPTTALSTPPVPHAAQSVLRNLRNLCAHFWHSASRMSKVRILSDVALAATRSLSIQRFGSNPMSDATRQGCKNMFVVQNRAPL